MRDEKGRFRKGFNGFWLGRKHTKKSKLKISKSKLGAVSPRKGLKLTEDIKKRMGLSKIGKHYSPKTEFQRGHEPWNKGVNYTDEAREKLRQAYFKNPRSLEKLKEYSLKGAQVLSLRKETSIEKKVYEELKKRGILFERQKLINGKFLVDAYIPSLNLIIECDGDYWHGLERVKKKDKAENAYLTKCGYKLLRLSEAEINNGIFKERLVN